MIPHIIIVFLILTYTLRTYLWFIWSRLTRKLPNGPLPLPFLGNVLELDPERPYITYTKLAEKYGKFYSVMLGDRPAVVITDLDLTKKVFKDARSTGRPSTIHDHMGINSNRGIVFWEGTTWRELRRFSMAALKDSGMVGALAEDYIQEEVVKVLAKLEKAEPVDTMMLMNSATANVIARLLFGRKFDTDSEEFQCFIRDIIQNFRDQSHSGLLEVLQWLRYVPPYRETVNKMRDRYLRLHRAIRDIIEEHKRTFYERDPRDYIHCCLKEQKAGNPTFADEQLTHSSTDIFHGGIETTASTIQWALLYIILNPEVQPKLHQELDRELAPDECLRYKDLSRLPYLEAFILEVSRIASIAPFFVPHRLTEDMDIEGFKIPAGIEILAVNWAMAHDSDIFSDPYKFQPERFLNADGKVDREQSQLIIPFSIGKRVCPGESLARRELCIFLGSIFKNFTIRPEKPTELTLDAINGLVLGVKPFRILASRRNNQRFHVDN